MRHHLRIVWLLALAVGNLPLLSSSPPTRMTARAKSIIQELINDKIAPGVAIGVVSKDRIETICLGRTALSGGTPIDEHTVFQIGSTTKAFTGGRTATASAC